MILGLGKRPDGRGPADIRPIWCEWALAAGARLGTVHAQETQILSIATLGTLGEAQELDNLSPVKDKRYMHHYNFPPYSTGEAQGAARAEPARSGTAPWQMASKPVIPAEETFPYTIRVVSEALFERVHFDGLGLRLNPGADGRVSRSNPRWPAWPWA